MAITTFLNEAELPARTQEQTVFDAAMAYVMRTLPIWGGEVNGALALMNALAAGGGISLGYTFSTTTTDADPGAGFLRLDSAAQSAATMIRVDLTSGGVDVTSVLDFMDDSPSINKGQIRLVKSGDPSKWLIFGLTAIASPAGYRNFTVALIGGSAASPFVNGDSLILQFTRTGDLGTSGTATLRESSTATSATPTPNATNTDLYVLTALASAATFAAPSGVPVGGQRLVIRIKDNGTARALAWNVAYRQSPDMVLPATTIVNKTMYVGFIYNSADSKWDLVALMNNF